MLETKFVAQDNKFPIHFEEIFRYDNINNSPKDVLEILNQIKSKINENINLLSNNIYDKNYKLYYSDYINKLDTFIKELKEYSNFENKKNHKCYDIKYYENITLELKNLERQFNFYNIETFKKNIESYNNNLNNNVIFEEKELENKINENITKNEQQLQNYEKVKETIQKEYNILNSERYSKYLKDQEQIDILSKYLLPLNKKSKQLLPLNLKPEQINTYINKKRIITINYLKYKNI